MTYHDIILPSWKCHASGTTTIFSLKTPLDTNCSRPKWDGTHTFCGLPNAGDTGRLDGHHRDLMEKNHDVPMKFIHFRNPKSVPNGFSWGKINIFIWNSKFSSRSPWSKCVTIIDQLGNNCNVDFFDLRLAEHPHILKTLHQANAAPKHPEGPLQDSIFIGEEGNLFWSLESSTSVNLHGFHFKQVFKLLNQNLPDLLVSNI